MKINVLYGCDDNYAPYTGISMTSLFENNQSEEIVVYLAAMNISQENVKRFEYLARQYGRKLIVLDTELAVKKMKEYNCGTWNDSLAAWLRFFVLDQIPNEVDNLIWLDSDTIVGKNFSDILSVEHQNKALGAVCDCISIYQRYRLGFHEDDPYYNSGVIIFYMPYWRENNLIQGMMTHLQKNVAKYKIPDQDMMNDYFKGRIQKLPPQYNMQGFLFAYNTDEYFSVYKWHPDAYYTPQIVKQAISKPVITHFFRFLGDYPWTQGKNYHPCKALFEQWKAKSLWNDHPGAPERKELSFQIEKFLYCFLRRKTFLKFFAWYTNRKQPKNPQ